MWCTNSPANSTKPSRGICGEAAAISCRTSWQLPSFAILPPLVHAAAHHTWRQAERKILFQYGSCAWPTEEYSAEAVGFGENVRDKNMYHNCQDLKFNTELGRLLGPLHHWSILLIALSREPSVSATSCGSVLTSFSKHRIIKLQRPVLVYYYYSLSFYIADVMVTPICCSTPCAEVKLLLRVRQNLLHWIIVLHYKCAYVYCTVVRNFLLFDVLVLPTLWMFVYAKCYG